jgi:hypothetical protein
MSVTFGNQGLHSTEITAMHKQLTIKAANRQSVASR